MIDLKILYNGIYDARIKNYIHSVSITDDISVKNSTMTITLADIDRRFSRGAWAAFSGDTVSIEMDGAKVGTYTITGIAIDTAAHSVTWKGKRRAVVTAPAKTPTKGKKPRGGGAMSSVLGLGREDGTPTQTAAKVAQAVGLSLRISTPAPQGWTAPLALSCFAQTGAAILDDLCARTGAQWSADSERIDVYPADTPTASKTAQTGPKSAGVRVVVLPMSQIVSFAASSEIAPARVEAATWSADTKKATLQKAGAGAGAVLQTREKLAAASAVYENMIKNAGFDEVQIVPRSDIMAGCVVKIDGARRQVTQMRFSISADGGETMGLTTKAAK